MKKISRILSVVLILTMLFSLTLPFASAEDKAHVKQYNRDFEEGYGGYLVFGDSVTRGYGSVEGNAAYHDRTKRYVPNSYPLLVAQAVGCNVTDFPANDMTSGDYWPASNPGLCLSVVLDALGIEDNYDDPVKYVGMGKVHNSDQFLSEQHFNQEEMRQRLKDASLITIALGMGDVVWRAGILAGDISELPNMDTDQKVQFAKDYVVYLNEGYNYWVSHYTLLLDEIKKVNPDADVVIVGNLNLIGDAVLTDESFMPIGDILSPRIALMNQYCRQWAQEYGYAYADISNTQLPVSVNDWSILGDGFMANYDTATHPDAEGYAYIARQILAVLPQVVDKEDGSAEVVTEDPVQDVPIVIPIPGTNITVPVVIPGEIIHPNTDINVDLGRFTKVNYVMVDNKIVKNWDFDEDNPYELQIPYNRKDAKILTVVVVQEDGKIVVQTYQLAYHDGYTAYRIYTTNNAVRTATNLMTSLYNIGSKIATAILGLFKK